MYFTLIITQLQPSKLHYITVYNNSDSIDAVVFRTILIDNDNVIREMIVPRLVTS